MCTAWLVRRVIPVYSKLSYLFGGKSFWFESWDFMWNLVKSCYFSLRLWFCNCLQLSWFYFHKNGGEFVKSWDISAGYHNISHQICSFCEKLRNLEIFWEWLVNCVGFTDPTLQQGLPTPTPLWGFAQVALTDRDKFYQGMAVSFFLRFFQISGNSPQLAIFFRLILPFQYVKSSISKKTGTHVCITCISNIKRAQCSWCQRNMPHQLFFLIFFFLQLPWTVDDV